MIRGATVFVGDSITMGLAPHVAADGEKFTIAEGGRTSAWALDRVRASSVGGFFARFRNAVVLLGTNDLGAGESVDAIYANLAAITRTLRGAGVQNVYALTVPPFGGYAPYASRFPEIERRRNELNRRIASSSESGGTFFSTASSETTRAVRLDVFLADPSNPSRLARKFDGGDGLHPDKRALGAVLSAELGESRIDTARGGGAGIVVIVGLLAWLALD